MSRTIYLLSIKIAPEGSPSQPYFREIAVGSYAEAQAITHALTKEGATCKPVVHEVLSPKDAIAAILSLKYGA